jgi:hypothetical protein
MPCLSGRYDPALGPILSIGFLLPGEKPPGPGAPSQTTLFAPLIDTGASVTCVSPQVVQMLGLHPIGQRQMISANRVAPVNTYLVDIVIPFGSVSGLRAGQQVAEFAPPEGSPFQVLLGRDVVCHGVFTLSFDGHFSFAL